MSNTELAPCPFCGGNVIQIDRNAEGKWFIACKSCGVLCPSLSFDNEKAITAWNTRQPSTIDKDGLKKICTSFFYWWHNQPGSNTESGFDDWIEGKGAKFLASLPSTNNEWVSLEKGLPKASGPIFNEKLYEVCDINDKRSADVVAFNNVRGMFCDTYYHEDYDENITHYREFRFPSKQGKGE